MYVVLKKYLGKTWVQIVLIILIFLLIRSYTQYGAIKGKAPGFEAHLLDRTPVSLSQYAGQPLLVHFWATWCGICRMEESSIESIKDDHAVITVAMQSGTSQEVAAYLKERNLHFSVINDPDGELAALYGAKAVPASFILDGKGNVRFVEFGYTTELGLRLRLWLAGIESRS